MRGGLLHSVTYDSGEMAQLKIINEVLSQTREKSRFNAACDSRDSCFANIPS